MTARKERVTKIIHQTPQGFRLKRILQGHNDVIYRLAWSPDGKMLASSSSDKTIRLWVVETGQECRKLEGYSNRNLSVAWSPNGRTLASEAYDNAIFLWDVITGKPYELLEGHSKRVCSLAWSPDGQTLASGSFDNTIRLWEVENRKQARVLEGHYKEVNWINWSPDGQKIVSGSADKIIRIWDVKTGNVIKTLEGHSREISSVVWSPNRKSLVSASYDTTLRVWNPRTGKLINILEGHTYHVNSVSFSFDSQFLASKSGDGTVRLWRCNSWKAISMIVEPASDSWCSSIAFHPKLPILATLGEYDTVIRIWELDIKFLLDLPPMIFQSPSSDRTKQRKFNYTKEPQLIKITEEKKKDKIVLKKGKKNIGNFDAFLAYNHFDRSQVIAIAEELKKRGLNPWIDIEQIPPGRWFQDIIQKTIPNVKSAAIIIGSKGLGKWQALELRAFISECVKKNMPVIPILLPGITKLPRGLLFLKELNWVRFSESIDEPEVLDNLEWGITGKHPSRETKKNDS